jgi:hypothetical protein
MNNDILVNPKIICQIGFAISDRSLSHADCWLVVDNDALIFTSVFRHKIVKDFAALCADLRDVGK